MNKYTIAIVLAAGQGKRMNASVPKQYLLVKEKPILYYTLKAFEESFVDEIVLVTGPGEEEYCQKTFVQKYDFKKVTGIVAGGKERYHSVYNALDFIESKEKTDSIVFIHDGARPFVTNDILQRAYVAAVDAETMTNAGVPSIQIHTGGMCHLDADMTRQGLKEFGTKDLDLVILENVGNLVCPAEFDTGAVKNMTILSVPEGHDKPLKYPLMYETCDLLVINKIDVLPYFDFDKEKVVEYAKMRNPKIDIIFISAKTGEGVAEVAEWILRNTKEWIEN